MNRLLSSAILSSAVLAGTAVAASALPLSATPEPTTALRWSTVTIVIAAAIQIMRIAIRAAGTASTVDALIAEFAARTSDSSSANVTAGTIAGTGTGTGIGTRLEPEQDRFGSSRLA